jgi:hypothetical protein
MADSEPRASLSPLFTWRSAIASPESALPPTPRLVALVLSLHMNERGASCFPSVATIAAEAGLSDRAVQKAIRCLTEAGWLIVKLGGSAQGGRRIANTYRATFPDGYLQVIEEASGPVNVVHLSGRGPVNVTTATGERGSGQDVKSAKTTGRASARTADGLDLDPVYRWLDVLGIEYAEDGAAFFAELAERFGIDRASDLAASLHAEALGKAEARAAREERSA